MTLMVFGGMMAPALPREGGYDSCGTCYRKAFNRNPPQNPANPVAQWRADILTDFTRPHCSRRSIQTFGVMAPNIYD